MTDQTCNPAVPAHGGPPVPVNHVFVDFENVHSFDPAVLRAKTATFTILIGARQTRMDLALVERLLPHAGSVELVRLESSGRNALDFALAYYVGRKAVVDPTGYFHIVSGDKGFDPLIGHLRSRCLKVRRHDGFDTLTFSGQPKASRELPKVSRIQPEDSFGRALSHLARNPHNRPRRQKALMSYLQNLCGKNSTESQAQSLVAVLQKEGHVKVDEKGAVSYQV